MFKNSLCYIIPDYDENTSENRLHLYEFLEVLGTNIPLIVFFEKANQKPVIKNIKYIYTQKYSFSLFNYLERFFVLLYFRLKGGKKFYIHYSYLSAIICGIITRTLGGKTFYWHCERFANYGNDKQGLEKLWWQLTDDVPLRMALHLCQYFITGSKTIVENYIYLFGINQKKIKILPNSINTKRFMINLDKKDVRNKLNLPKDKNIILFVHWLSPRKGVYNLLEIIKQTIQSMPNVIFLIIGDGPLKQWLSNEIAKLKLEDFVIIKGRIPNKDLPYYYDASDIFIMPSLQEGFPRVLLECMAAGLPFVATNSGCVREISPESQQEYVVDAKDINLFSKKLIELIKTNKKRNRSCKPKTLS